MLFDASSLLLARSRRLVSFRAQNATGIGERDTLFFAGAASFFMYDKLRQCQISGAERDFH